MLDLHKRDVPTVLHAKVPGGSTAQNLWWGCVAKFSKL